VDVILLAVELYNLRLKIPAHIGEDGSHVIHDNPADNAPPVFSYKYQMKVHVENTMPALPDFT